MDMRGKTLGEYITAFPASTVAEAVRTIRTSLMLRFDRQEETQENASGHVVTLTSSFMGEGKTTLSYWLAQQAAIAGKKVILLECDLRRPSLAHLKDRIKPSTLVDYLTGRSGLEKAIQVDDKTGLHTLYGESVPNSALDLLASQKMRTLLKSLRQAYDLIILDGPASLSVPDARILATYSDRVLYCVQWNRTPAETVDNGIKQFAVTGLEKVAFVLSKVDLKQHARYGYGNVGYYYGQAEDVA